MPVQLISINSLGLPAKPCVYAGDYSSYLWNLSPQSLPRDAKIAYATIARLQLATYESFIPIVTNLQLGKKKKKDQDIREQKQSVSPTRLARSLVGLGIRDSSRRFDISTGNISCKIDSDSAICTCHRVVTHACTHCRGAAL